jgi:hypothetical protein
MAHNRKGSPHQAKHFQPSDHEHAAHQEQAAHGHGNPPGHVVVEGDAKTPAKRGRYPADRAPKGPRKGQ